MPNDGRIAGTLVVPAYTFKSNSYLAGGVIPEAEVTAFEFESDVAKLALTDYVEHPIACSCAASVRKCEWSMRSPIRSGFYVSDSKMQNRKEAFGEYFEHYLKSCLQDADLMTARSIYAYFSAYRDIFEERGHSQLCDEVQSAFMQRSRQAIAKKKAIKIPGLAPPLGLAVDWKKVPRRTVDIEFCVSRIGVCATRAGLALFGYYGVTTAVYQGAYVGQFSRAQLAERVAQDFKTDAGGASERVRESTEREYVMGENGYVFRRFIFRPHGVTDEERMNPVFGGEASKRRRICLREAPLKALKQPKKPLLSFRLF